MSDSFRQPRRILLVALGALTIFYLVAPSLVIIPLSFTETRSLTFPPSGFSLQWYQRMFSERQWSTGLVNSLEVAALSTTLMLVTTTLLFLAFVVRRQEPTR